MRVATMLGLASVLAAGAAAAGDAKSDLAKLQGKWTFEKEGAKAEIYFSKNDFTIKIDSDEIEGTFKADPSKKPKQMDLMITGKRFMGETLHAIYDLDGDSLKWCTSKPRKDRPTEFPAKEGEEREYLYMVFKRVKS